MVRPEGARANRGFAIRVSRSVASSRGMGGAKTVRGARARVSDGSFPRGCPTAREWTRAERESNGAGREIATPTRARS